MAATHINCYYYNNLEFVEHPNVDLDMCLHLDTEKYICWVDVVGLDNRELLHKIAEGFEIHALAFEDILHTEQRAKLEDYDNYQYLVLKMSRLFNNELQDQQVSFWVRDNLVLSFREHDWGFFNPVIERLRVSTSVLRKRGEDFLLYRLIDVIIDAYYDVLQIVGNELEQLDDLILKRPADSHIIKLQKLKSDVLWLRKNLLPVRDLVLVLDRNDITFFEKDNKVYLRDLKDHMLRNVEEVEFHREQLSSLMDLYYSLQQYKMNNVMKTLTGVSFVLLPLTFIASLYGMNFSVIPRADDPWGFYEVVAGMILIAGVLIWFAFRRQWLSSKDFNKR